MPAKPEQPLMAAILDVLNHAYEIAHLAEHSDLPSPRLVNGFRAKLDTLGALYEAAKPKPECCFCFTSDAPLMNVGEGDDPPFTYAKAWMLAAATSEIHACQRCFTGRDDCFGAWRIDTE